MAGFFIGNNYDVLKSQIWHCPLSVVLFIDLTVAYKRYH